MLIMRHFSQSARMPFPPLSLSLPFLLSEWVCVGGWREWKHFIKKDLRSTAKGPACICLTLGRIFCSTSAELLFFSCSDGFVITINARKEIDLPFFTKFMGLLRAAVIVARWLLPFVAWVMRPFPSWQTSWDSLFDCCCCCCWAGFSWIHES